MRAFSFICLLGVLAVVGETAFGQYPARQGYMPLQQKPQPQRTAAAPPTAPATPPGSGGKVMYFSKPADSLVSVSGTDDAVAQNTPPMPEGTVPELPMLSVQPTAPAPVVAAPAFQPGMMVTAQKQPDPKQPMPVGKATDPADYTKLPAREDIFNLLGDKDLEQRVLKLLREAEAKRPPDQKTGKPVDPYAKYPPTLTFPPIPPVGGNIAYVPKTTTYPPMQTSYDALYVVHRRLHFEDKNAERYGWDFGIIQPLVSAGIFYKDVLLWPHSLASGWAYGFWDTSAGKCMPGSPTPYMLYPPELTITGSVVEGVIITGAAFAIP